MTSKGTQAAALPVLQLSKLAEAVAGFSAHELIWASGYLYGLAQAGGVAAAGGVAQDLDAFERLGAAGAEERAEDQFVLEALGLVHGDDLDQLRVAFQAQHALVAVFAFAGDLLGQLELIRERREARALHRYPLVTCERRLEGMIGQIDAQASIASLRGLEGAAAASYFEALSEILPERLHFSGRNRQPPRDPVNALLSLTYTLLHAEAVLALYGAGLDPYVGFYHALDFGRESRSGVEDIASRQPNHILHRDSVCGR